MKTAKREYELSLNKLLGKAKIKDVYGFVSDEVGDPCFKLTRIVFTDDTQMDCEGEHDHPYLVGDRLVLPEETICSLCQGSGIDPDGGTDMAPEPKCPECNGTGEVE